MDKPADNRKMNRTFADSVAYLLNQSGRLFRERLSQALTPLGLSVYEYGILRLISLNTPMSQGVLGSQYGIDRTTMVTVVDNLEERAMVARERRVNDRRSYRLLLTPKGKKVLARALRIATNEQQKFLAPMTQSEWSVVRNCLWRLIEVHSRDADLPQVKGKVGKGKKPRDHQTS